MSLRVFTHLEDMRHINLVEYQIQHFHRVPGRLSLVIQVLVWRHVPITQDDERLLLGITV